MATAHLVAESEEHLRDLPLDPIYVGLSVFVVLLILLVGVLMFGKGRPHS